MRVVWHRGTGPTGRLLEDQLAGVTSNYTLNWGYAGSCQFRPGERVINLPRAVALAANKPLAREALWQAGVPTLRSMSTEEALYEMRTNERQMIARKQLTARGEGVMVAAGVHQFEVITRTLHPGDGWWWQDYWDCDQEFRVHVIAGKVVKISEKVDGRGWVRNHANGWRFCVPTIPKEERRDVRRAAKDAVAALHLDFGAVDVMRRSGGGQVMVTEVNTAPALTDERSNTAERYVRHITENWGRG